MKKISILVLSLLISAQLLSQDFAQWRSVNRDGKYQETSLLKVWPVDGPELLWHFDELGDGHASVAIADDKIFTAGTIDDIGYIFAFNMSGELQWKVAYGPEWTQSWPGVRSTPLIIDKKLYLLSGFGKLTCMNTNDGSLLWEIDFMKEYGGLNIQWGFCENLLVDGKQLFVTVGGADANIVSVNKNDGKLIWKSKGKGEKSAYGSPALIIHNGRKLLIAHTEFSVLGLDAVSGKMLWSHEKKNRWAVHPNTPIYHEGQLYCVSGYGSGGIMLKLSDDGTNVTEVWKNISLDNQMGGVILLDGKLYGGGQNSKKFYCLDWNTGAELFETKDVQRGNSIYADGLIYFYDERGFINLLKPDGASTKVISKFKVPFGSAQHWAHLVINNKKLYLRHGNSLMLYSISE